MVESKHKWKAWLYLAPAIILLLIFTVWPIINTLRMAFLNGYGVQSEIGGVEFKFGFANFREVLTFNEYSEFKECLENTLLLTFITVPISTFLALLIAVGLNSIGPLRRFLQTIFFLPYVTNSIAIGMVFTTIFQPIGLRVVQGVETATSWGFFNQIIGFFGANPINWTGPRSDKWANMVVLIIYIVWNALPFKILILLGGLQGVNKQYYEAAKIDSTPRWRVFTRITVPMLSPMISYVVITGFIGGFKEYSSIVGIFGEDMKVPAGQSLNTMVGYIYQYTKGDAQGIASAAALVLFVIIFAVTMVNLYVSKKNTHY